MTPQEALSHFLAGALQKRWRERYASIIQTNRGKNTFLRDLYHELEDRLDSSKAIQQLPEEAWGLPAYSFSQSIGFGHLEQSLRTAFEVVRDGSLIIDTAGRYGVHKPEDMVDNIIYFKV